MRPIDADELKEQFLAKCVEECAICKYNNRLNAKETEYTCGLIDNAPTVEIPKALGTVDKNGNIRIELIRPQGEWSDESKDSLLCSACGKRVYKPFIGGFPTERTSHYYPNFCAFCGADMRKGEEE